MADSMANSTSLDVIRMNAELRSTVPVTIPIPIHHYLAFFHHPGPTKAPKKSSAFNVFVGWTSRTSPFKFGQNPKGSSNDLVLSREVSPPTQIPDSFCMITIYLKRSLIFFLPLASLGWCPVCPGGIFLPTTLLLGPLQWPAVPSSLFVCQTNSIAWLKIYLWEISCISIVQIGRGNKM